MILISSEARVGVAVMERDRERCRRDEARQRARECEPSFERDPRRHARRDPLDVAAVGCRCPICPAQLRAFIVHRYLLFNSYLFLQISKPCNLRIKETVLVPCGLDLWCFMFMFLLMSE